FGSVHGLVPGPASDLPNWLSRRACQPAPHTSQPGSELQGPARPRRKGHEPTGIKISSYLRIPPTDRDPKEQPGSIGAGTGGPVPGLPRRPWNFGYLAGSTA